MSKSRTHMTWRVMYEDTVDTSLDARLQTLALDPLKLTATVTRYRWVTVARGNPEDLREIADALNRARVTHFDISPEAKDMLYAHTHIGGTMDDDSKRVRGRGRLVSRREMASRGIAKRGVQHKAGG